MKGAGQWKFRCVATPVLCAHATRHVGGLLFLIKTLFFLTCFLWFLLSCQSSYYDLHDTMKEGATSRRCTAVSPLNKCLIQPPSATPKHTNTLLPEKTPSKVSDCSSSETVVLSRAFAFSLLRQQGSCVTMHLTKKT